MPTSHRSSKVSCSDSLNASACAADVLFWSMVRSSAAAFKLPSACRWASSRRRPREAACRSGAFAPGSASGRPS
eukprot:6190120-Pleurochrysis_carterae.AAC.1